MEKRSTLPGVLIALTIVFLLAYIGINKSMNWIDSSFVKTGRAPVIVLLIPTLVIGFIVILISAFLASLLKPSKIERIMSDIDRLEDNERRRVEQEQLHTMDDLTMYIGRDRDEERPLAQEEPAGVHRY